MGVLPFIELVERFQGDIRRFCAPIFVIVPQKKNLARLRASRFVLGWLLVVTLIRSLIEMIAGI